MKILMVCLGNICRSPLAEGIMREKARQKNLDIEVDSAGTISFHQGNPPDRRSIAVAKKYGIDLTPLRARPFTTEDFDTFDQIYVMDTMNYTDVMMMARTEKDKNKVELLLNVSNPGSNKVVPDPYHGGDEGFEKVFRMIDEACEAIANQKEKENENE